MQKLKRICVLFMSALLIFGCSFSSYADVNDLMIGTASNALMTMELGDSDYTVMPMSTLGSITNTIGTSGIKYRFQYYHAVADNIVFTQNYIPEYVNGSFVINKPPLASGDYITSIELAVPVSNLPRPGIYDFSFDFTSNVGASYTDFYIWNRKYYDNATSIVERLYLDFTSVSGDLLVFNEKIQLTSVDNVTFIVAVNNAPENRVNDISGYIRIQFTPSSGSTDNSTAGVGSSESDYEYGVSDSLSDLSSSVDTMTDEISGVTEAIQSLQGAMEPHYSNVLTQLHHITEQLHAFYDQVYNNIHLPELNMLTQIKEAIENIDLQIEVDISEVKTAINNMSTAVQNKLQSTTDQITGGYDNSGMSSDKSELDGVLDQYEQAEEQLFDDAKGHINDFEFNTPLDSFTGPLADVAYFLNGMFEAMGPMNVVISFSLTLTIAMVMIGWYRFKGGR